MCQQNGWWLINRDPLTRCVVNDEIVLLNQQVRLAEEDLIEWGLYAWAVLSADGHAQETKRVEQKNICSKIECPSAVQTQASPALLDLSWFNQRASALEQASNPFDLILPVQGDEFHGQLDGFNSQNAPIGDADPVAQLGKEYERALYEPQMQSTHQWHANLLSSEVDTSEKNRCDMLKGLAAQSDPFTSLQDMVVGTLHIDEVFAGLDSLRETDLFFEEDMPDILHIFAPEGFKQRLQSDSTPQLTRREHHAMSVDSHYRSSQPTADTKEEDPYADTPIENQ